ASQPVTAWQASRKLVHAIFAAIAGVGRALLHFTSTRCSDRRGVWGERRRAPSNGPSDATTIALHRGAQRMRSARSPMPRETPQPARTALDRSATATYVLIHGAGDVGWYWHVVE